MSFSYKGQPVEVIRKGTKNWRVKFGPDDERMVPKEEIEETPDSQEEVKVEVVAQEGITQPEEIVTQEVVEEPKVETIPTPVVVSVPPKKPEPITTELDMEKIRRSLPPWKRRFIADPKPNSERPPAPKVRYRR